MEKLSRLNYSIVLRVIACVFFIGALGNLNLVFFLESLPFGPIYQSRILVGIIVLTVTAYGLWVHKRWALWLYVGYTFTNQALIYLMGWPSSWIWLPLVAIVLIVANYEWLSPNQPIKRDAPKRAPYFRR